MVTFDEILDKIRRETEGPENTRERGTRFELLMKRFFETDSIQKNQFKKVQMWKDYSGIDGDIDKGIDLVGTYHDGYECAIQCKCWNDGATLNYKDVATTYADMAGREKMTRAVIVFTGQTIGSNASKHFHKTGTTVLMKDQLRESPIDWSEDGLKYKPEAKKPRPHQVAAINDVFEKFKQYDRGQLIMACGTGKTLVSLRIGERMVGAGGLVLYAVPSIYLIPQAMREWSDNRSIEHQYMAVCSDSTADRDAQGSITEVPMEPSTSVDKLRNGLLHRRKDAMCVIFSTYNSLPVVKEAVEGQFDMIFFDEAHKTASSRDSYYTMGHSDDNIRASKRLYMTATPRTYSEVARRKNANVNSMDDEDVFGPVFHKLRFSEARDMGILVPFKITMAEVSEGQLYEDIKAAGEESPDALNDLTKMYGAWQGINYPDGKDNPPKLLQRVIVFHNTVNKSKIFAGKKESKLAFGQLVEKSKNVYADMTGNVEIEHIDAKTRSSSRGMALDWLRKSNDKPDTCRVLTNARCLQEGVDIPALDGIIFMEPRRSGIDIIQSIGRVMRKPKGFDKEAGYVILPIPVPAGEGAKEAFENARRYGPVRDVLKAIVAHDDELMALINQTGLIHPAGQTNWIPEALESVLAKMLAVNPGNVPEYVKSIVLDLRDDSYYARYGVKLGKVAKRIETMIRAKIDHEPETSKKIDALHVELKAVVGETLTKNDAVKTLAQHIVLYRVFNMLFPDGFNNPISRAMESAMSGLDLDAELEEFKTFYSDVEYDIRLIKTPEERQEFIKKIYDSFLRGADKKSASKHGVVYTPVEIVDFIIHSIEHVLKTEFSTSLADPGASIKIFDPFTGAGTFIARLLESGIIPHDKLYDYYKHHIYANELILLAYYVASVNIEATYQSLMRGHRYVPFEGIALADTFDQDPRYRTSPARRKTIQKLDGSFKEAHERIRAQRWAHLHVIIGNPPYSGGQKTAKEYNQNVKHDVLEKRINETYIQSTPERNKKWLYNSYIKAFRWASDRIGESGMIGFVTPSSFIEGNSEAGLRACFDEEFTDIWCFDLLGKKDQKGHGRNVFEYKGVNEGGTTQGIAITILAKNPTKQGCTVHYARLRESDYSGEDKRNRIKDLGSILGVSDWDTKMPNKYYDWINIRGQEYEQFKDYIPIKSEKHTKGIFKMRTRGIVTARDDWVYNSSFGNLAHNMKRTISHCARQNLKLAQFGKEPARVTWTLDLERKIEKLPKPLRFSKSFIRIAQYRPFIKQYLYFDQTFIDRKRKMPELYPSRNTKNLTISITDKITSGFSAIVADAPSDFHIVKNSQCFALSYKSTSNVTSWALEQYQFFYNDKSITKEDIFYYVYGMLHHTGYRKKYQNILMHALPHIPMAPDFWAFCNLGRKLATLHLGYKTCKRYDLKEPLATIPDNPISVRFGTKPNPDRGKKKIIDPTTLIVNSVKIYDNLPPMKYEASGRTPIGWLTYVPDKPDSGIDRRLFRLMSGSDLRETIERLVYVGVESDKIIEELAKYEFETVDKKLRPASGQGTLDGNYQSALF